MNFITELLNQYGYVVLYLALLLELLGLPLPGEILMTYCGFLVLQGKLNFIICILFAAAGIISGITIAYFVGKKLGEGFFFKYGAKFHMGPDKMKKMTKLMDKYGNGLLIVAYFIPGVRHITGYISGVLNMDFKKFAINAYLGAIIWPFTFMIIGKTLGGDWGKLTKSISKYLIIGCIVIGILLIIAYAVKYYREQIMDLIGRIMKSCMRVFKSLEKVKFIVLISATFFIMFIGAFVALTQSLISNYFNKFDLVTSYLIQNIFTGDWINIFVRINTLGSDKIILAVTILMIIYVIKEDKDNLIELKLLILTILGGKIYADFLNFIFNKFVIVRNFMAGHIIYILPNEQVLMTVVVYGFIGFVLIRHMERHRSKNIIALILLLIFVSAGLGEIIIGQSYPTEIILAYILGGAWLSLNIILLEVFRVLQKIDKNKM